MKINIAGKLPLEFDGIIGQEWDNKYTDIGNTRDRYHKITLYKANGYYVISVEFFSLYAEHQYIEAGRFSLIKDITTYLEAFNPLEKTVIHSRHRDALSKERETKKNKLEWEALISNVFKDMNISQNLDHPTPSEFKNLNETNEYILTQLANKIRNRANKNNQSISDIIDDLIE